MNSNNPLHPIAPTESGQRQLWGSLYGSGIGLVTSQTAQEYPAPVILVTPDTATAQRIEYALKFYLGHSSTSVLSFPDWETLPYDIFSPHQDIISERLRTLYQLQDLESGIIIVPVQTLMHKVLPKDYINKNSLIINIGQDLNLEKFRLNLEESGYNCVSTVMEHGEFTVRGNILDIYPMGSNTPIRIELFDTEIDSIRIFDPETQRSTKKINDFHLLPAKEFPLDKDGISDFRQRYREKFEGDPTQSLIYKEISQGNSPAGVEYYIPLFFEKTETLFDYFSKSCLLFLMQGIESAADDFWSEINSRHEQLRHDVSRPILAPNELYLQTNEVFYAIKQFPQVVLQEYKFEQDYATNYSIIAPPELTMDARSENPLEKLTSYIKEFSEVNNGKILFTTETTGRRETLLELLNGHNIKPTQCNTWQDFLNSTNKLLITVFPLENGLVLPDEKIAVISEYQLFGNQVLQRRRRKTQKDTESVVRNLTELMIGSPVVHENYGVGRYQGLKTLFINENNTEFLLLEYAGNDKLYVPVSSLHLISRYTGTAPENAPLHRLGSGQWEKAKRKATEKVRDVAAELLDIYAKREAQTGFSYKIDQMQYHAFASTFPFEETPDQQTAIDNVITSMRSNKPMDHLICGDVGFGKTEVAMRAAFIAVQAGKQVAVLVPTTLLSQQHLENFRDRFSEWPIKVESLSRFKSKKEQDVTIEGLKNGTVDIVVGTHKLLQKSIKYKRLGLIVIDEEHRFGVRQKESFKAMRSKVDILTLTATPIPRTLNLAISGLRELSIIASPPKKRLAIKTFITEWNKDYIFEACLREIKRGGQVFFVHNDVESIASQTKKLQELLPDANINFAHGQMRERELEHVMSDFYHQRFNILVCTTIIETGIDIPSANTIIINRADKFGLAQLYQLRGRVGRSHHRAYAYLIIPSVKTISANARKRLEAIESIETLGTGFTLATHDLEIRGAGELLGDEQSGQMQEIGYTLYTELLERAVKALKDGVHPDVDLENQQIAEIDIQSPTLIPDDYLPDIHERLILYKRIASAKDNLDLKELQVEMIDRFGLLPDPCKRLFQVTKLKITASMIGIIKIELGAEGGRIIFNSKPNLDPMLIINLIQTQSSVYKLDGKDKLKISKEFEDPEQRIQFLNNLFSSFTLKNVA
ncbi:MAG: transcription-repair coupling factor [Thiohalomonadales bacterium]